tara:strand:+ start:797 stop:4471 length:3675 start_codon:yes stop_codon:yes gene_type:complete
MAKEESKDLSKINNPVTKPTVLFTDYRNSNSSVSNQPPDSYIFINNYKYPMLHLGTNQDNIYKPFRLHATDGEPDASYDPAMKEAGYANQGKTPENYIYKLYDQSYELIRSWCGALWYSTDNLTCNFLNKHPKAYTHTYPISALSEQGNESPTVPIFMKKEVDGVKYSQRLYTAVDGFTLYGSGDSKSFAPAGPQDCFMTAEMFDIVTTIVPSFVGAGSKLDMWKKTKMLEIAWELSKQHSEPFYDYVADYGQIPSKDEATTIANLGLQVAHVTATPEHNFELPHSFKQAVNNPLFSESPMQTMWFRLLPNYFCYLLFKHFPNLNVEQSTELSKYKQYVKNMLLMNHVSVSDAMPNLQPESLAKYNSLISNQNNLHGYLNDKDTMKFIIEYGKLLNGYFENGISTGGDPWISKNSDVQKNVVIMQSVLQLVKEAYDNQEMPHCLKFESAMPSSVVTATDQTEFTRIKSLIELLDRHDLDYTLLKTLVEDNYYNPGPNNPGAAMLTEDIKNQYNLVSSDNYALGSDNVWKPIIVGDEIGTFPKLKFTDQDIKSMSLYGREVTIPSPAQGRNPYLNSLYFKDDNIFLNEDIYPKADLNSSHIFLDIPGDEDIDQPFLKRIAAEGDSIPAVSSLLGNNFYNQPETISELTSLRQDGGNTRTFKEILEGEKAKSEIVYFQINKYVEAYDETGQIAQNLLQTFWIPNAPEFNPQHFIDSQITSNDNKTFVYKIFAWTAIYGNKYYYKLRGLNVFNTYEQQKGNTLPTMADFFGGSSYRNLDIETGAKIFDKIREIQSFDLDGPLILESEYLGDNNIDRFYNYQISFNTEMYPDVKLIKVPFHPVGGVVDSTQVFRPPPSPPTVEIVPYEGVDNSLLFLLNARVGATHKDFIIGIEDKDSDQVQTIYEALISSAKGWNANNLEQEFITQDVKKFEIYRLDNKPKSYSDFAPENGGTKMDLIPPTTKGKYEGFGGTDFVFDNGPQDLSIVASTAQFNSSVVPNKKYYYTFRVVDQEDYFSNPTPVYQVEIINDGGTIYPLIDVIDFDIENKLQTKKNIRKYLHIIPTLENSLINLEDVDFENETAGSYINKLSGKKPSLGVNPESQLLLPEENYENDGKKTYVKLRLTSKKTGKKIDINLKAMHKHVKTTQEEEGFQKGSNVPPPELPDQSSQQQQQQQQQQPTSDVQIQTLDPPSGGQQQIQQSNVEIQSSGGNTVQASTPTQNTGLTRY